MAKKNRYWQFYLAILVRKLLLTTKPQLVTWLIPQSRTLSDRGTQSKQRFRFKQYFFFVFFFNCMTHLPEAICIFLCLPSDFLAELKSLSPEHMDDQD